MNEYDFEDAFKDANRYAGSVVKLSEALKTVESESQGEALLVDLRKQYSSLFSAFIAGVAWERENVRLRSGKA